jgi:hypothetical protein
MWKRCGKMALCAFNQSQAKMRVGRAGLDFCSSMESRIRFPILTQIKS